MLKSQSPVSLKGVAALGAIVTVAALTGCVTRTKEVVVERPMQPATIVVQQPATAPANVRTMPGPINEQRGVAPAAGYSWLSGYWAWGKSTFFLKFDSSSLLLDSSSFLLGSF